MARAIIVPLGSDAITNDLAFPVVVFRPAAVHRVVW